MSELEVNQLLKKQLKDIYGPNFELTNLDTNVQALINKVSNSYTNLDYHVKQNNILFEEEENIVFTIGMNAGVLRANKKFYKTFGFKNLLDFKKTYNCICELFISSKEYLKETTIHAHWTDPITQNPHKRHKALIRDFSGEKRVYSVLLKELTIEDVPLKICTFTDITELEEAISTSKRLEEVKTLFMANMSHEIRTPMNGIVGFTSLLLGTKLSPEQQQFLQLIDESATVLSEIINDVLDFSKIENGSLELDFINVNIFTDFYFAISLFKEEALQRNISYRVDIDPDISESLLMDKGRIVKVLNNLISNAIKFTLEKGEVLIDIQLLKATKTKELVSFSVTDTGIGINKNDLKSIFKSFMQGNNGFTKEFGGTGLGLSISNSLCQLMDSELKVKSILGKGSTFSFEINFEKTTAENTLSTLTKERTIYLVEDKSRDHSNVLYQLEHFSINFIQISKEAILSSKISNHIVIIFNYREYLSLKLSHNSIILVDDKKEAFFFSKEFDNIYHISAFITFPSELYNAIVALNDALHTEIRKKHFDLKVLVAEDSRLNRVLLDEMLLEYDIQADFVEDGKGAVEMATKNTYDLILMDINMPNLNGAEANKILKRKEINIPIVAVTANALKGDRQRLLDLGLDDYLSKPISVDSLYNILLKYH
ncbi:MAG: Unknown protein [uncultured Sulfurovum sp.]|uniref:histidine kinase n=1 Tax=uncultured Sulfurovum sp. TaxID=269237 RepID=A0A6S6S5E6_9BACT|nr:MAG: Unknown protein [uncultured Sulfurovum sp.]